MLLYNKLYNKLVSLFKSIKLLVFIKKTTSILKSTKYIEFEEIVDLIAQKSRKAIDNFILLSTFDRQIIARITNIEYYFNRNFKLTFFDNKNKKSKLISFLISKSFIIIFTTNLKKRVDKNFIIFTTSFKKRVLVLKAKLINFAITSKNKLMQQIKIAILLSRFILSRVLSTIELNNFVQIEIIKIFKTISTLLENFYNKTNKLNAQFVAITTIILIAININSSKYRNKLLKYVV